MQSPGHEQDGKSEVTVRIFRLARLVEFMRLAAAVRAVAWGPIPTQIIFNGALARRGPLIESFPPGSDIWGPPRRPLARP
jgi:hypothetical protein